MEFQLTDRNEIVIQLDRIESDRLVGDEIEHRSICKDIYLYADAFFLSGGSQGFFLSGGNHGKETLPVFVDIGAEYGKIKQNETGEKYSWLR